MDVNYYHNQADEFIAATGTQITITASRQCGEFEYYNAVIQTKRGTYEFEFQDALFNVNARERGEWVRPHAYDVLAGLVKFEPESFDIFCDDYDYALSDPWAIDEYNNVVEEWKNVQRLFSADEIELLSHIQ